ncbi:hypothetical protein MKX03_009992 [Papaver bracteatum]|nr:hypothetical protein MKX03_009992 [Papaver bracteatum]
MLLTISLSHMYATNENQDNTNLSKEGTGRDGLGTLVPYQYQGFWCSADRIESVNDFQQNFKALDIDLILETLPKSGSTWLKSLAFSIVNRINYHFSGNYHQHPLLSISPHDLILFVDFKHILPDDKFLDFTKTISILMTMILHACRLIATHVPYPSLAESIKNPPINCKIVYLCRNPQDTFISMWISLSIDEAFEFFYEGVSQFGPFWEHVLGYWKESLKNPHKKLAEFMGYSFSTEEETHGVIEDILSLCSFEHLKNLDVNKNGHWNLVANQVFFRTWFAKNYLTPLIVERLDRLMEKSCMAQG